MAKVFVTTENLELDDEPEFKFNADSFITYWMTLKNRSLLGKYQYFQYLQTRSNTKTSIALQIMITVCAIYKSWTTFQIQQNPLSLLNFVFALVFVVAIGWSGVLVKLRTRIFRSASVYWTIWLETSWFFCVNLWFDLNIVLSGAAECQSNKVGCKYFKMADEKMLVAMCLPTFAYMVMRCTRWEVVVGSYVMNIVVLLTCAYAYDLEVSKLLFWSFIPFTTLILFEYQRQLLVQFATMITQQGVLDEKSRRFDEMQKNELKHLMGNVAHDLKTPLSSFVQGVEFIKSTAEEMGASLLKEYFDRNVLIEQISDILEKTVNILNTNSFMTMTINRCIDYTKARNKMKLVPQKDTINLQETIDLPLQCAKDLQTDKICVFAHSLPKNITSCIVTDKLWLQESLLCLLTNAVKYSTVGNVTLSVCLSAPMRRRASQPTLMYDTYETEESATYQLEMFSSCDDERTALDSNSGFMVLRFEVEDTGIGLSDEAMANLFKPAKQAERLASGTGLGLFSLARRMEALGGMYGVQKRRDGKRGSLFWFEIPYRPVVEPPPTLHESLSVAGDVDDDELLLQESDTPAPVKLNILVADDCVFILKTCKQMFRRAGHLVTTAENGNEALKLIKENKNGPNKDVFDVVLMDLQMPFMDGLQATTELRKYEELYCSSPHQVGSGSAAKYADSSVLEAKDTSHLLVIGVSNAADKETIKEAFIAGVDAFIPKPFNLKAFSEVYSSLISRPAGY